MTKPHRLLLALLALVVGVSLGACSSLSGVDGGGSQGAASEELKGTTLRIVAATELKALDSVVAQAAKDLGMTIEMAYPGGTLDNTERLGEGEFDGYYDATWFATNRYAELQGLKGRFTSTSSVASSPVLLGVRPTTAAELGWDKTQPTWAEIAQAASSGALKFGMTDPGTSNSGFSALASVATSFADTGSALSTQDIARVAPQVREFFSGQTVTSGSSGWLTAAFRSETGKANAILSNEASLIDLKNQGEDIDLIAPSDGVIFADYPLSALSTADQPLAKEKAQALAGWLEQHPQELADAGLRPTTAGDSARNPDFAPGLLLEIPFPASQDVVSALIDSYNNDLRSPGAMAFMLDTSGSMAGDRIASLKATLHSLADGSAQVNGTSVGFRDREDITFVPFSTAVHDQRSLVFDAANAATVGEVGSAIEALDPSGDTAIYEALAAAYDHLGASASNIRSIVLMSDGELTAGRSFDDFRAYYEALPNQVKTIPTFVILYGEANAEEMTALAELTGGKVFDAQRGDLASAFKEIRGYQ